jgi:hypothetical protein
MKTIRICVLSVFCTCVTALSIANGQKVQSDNGNALIAQSTLQCGVVPIKPIVPVQCSNLTPVCDTSTNQWEWHCVARTQPLQCGIVPIKPIVPVQCSDLVPECDTQSGKWHWICVARNGIITTGTYNNSQIITNTTSTVTSNTTSQRPQNNATTQQSSAYQDSYQTGYAATELIGNIIGAAIDKHHIKSFCKKHGDAAYWKFEDSSIMSCASVNAGKPVREFPALKRQFDSDLQKQGMRAYELMEGLRQNLNELTSYGDSPIVQDAKNSWVNVRDLYCEASPGAVYINLQNQQQTCPQ